MSMFETSAGEQRSELLSLPERENSSISLIARVEDFSLKMEGRQNQNNSTNVAFEEYPLPEISLPPPGKLSPAEESGSEKVAETIIVHAGKGTELTAKAGYTVYAESGSFVNAEKGAIVIARAGSKVMALDGTSVNAAQEPTIHQEKGAVVNVDYRAKIHAYKDAVIKMSEGEVTLYDGATCYAASMFYFPAPGGVTRPLIHTKGKCMIFATEGVRFDFEKGSQPTIEKWNVKRTIESE